MGRTVINICDTHIVPETCRERFLPLDHPSALCLREHEVSMAGLSDLGPGYEMGRRAPRFHLLLYTLAGGGELWTAAGAARLRPGSLLIMPGMTPHAYRIAAPRWRILWFHLKIRKSWSALEGAPWVVRTDHLGGALAPLMEGLLREAALDSIDARRAAALYAELIAIQLHREVRMIDDPRQRRLEEQVRRLAMEIDADLAHPWTIEDLARRMHLSAGHFHRVIGQYFETTPMRLVLRLRMQRAEAMLKNTDESVAAIAASVGYENPFAFSVAFKRWTGLGPRAYRQRERRHQDNFSG